MALSHENKWEQHNECLPGLAFWRYIFKQYVADPSWRSIQADTLVSSEWLGKIKPPSPTEMSLYNHGVEAISDWRWKWGLTTVNTIALAPPFSLLWPIFRRGFGPCSYFILHMVTLAEAHDYILDQDRRNWSWRRREDNIGLDLNQIMKVSDVESGRAVDLTWLTEVYRWSEFDPTNLCGCSFYEQVILLVNNILSVNTAYVTPPNISFEIFEIMSKH